MRKAIDITDKMRNDIIQMINTRTLKDISNELNIPYHVVMAVNLSIITKQVKEHRLHCDKMKSLGIEYVSSSRERFEQGRFEQINGILYKIIPSDENEWIKNDDEN